MKDMENTTPDGGEVQARTEPSAQDNASSAIDYEKLAKALGPTLSDLVERQTQSVKDKRIAGLQGKVDGFEAELAKFTEYTKRGMSQDDALWRMRVERQIFGDDAGDLVNEANPPAVSDGNGDQGGSSVDVDTLQAIGLDPNSPDVTDLLRRGASLQDYVALKVKQTKKPAPTPASVMPTPGQGASTGAEIEDVTNRLLTLQQNPLKNRDEILKLSAELKQLQSQR